MAGQEDAVCESRCGVGCVRVCTRPHLTNSFIHCLGKNSTDHHHHRGWLCVTLSASASDCSTMMWCSSPNVNWLGAPALCHVCVNELTPRIVHNCEHRVPFNSVDAGRTSAAISIILLVRLFSSLSNSAHKVCGRTNRTELVFNHSICPCRTWFSVQFFSSFSPVSESLFEHFAIYFARKRAKLTKVFEIILCEQFFWKKLTVPRRKSSTQICFFVGFFLIFFRLSSNGMDPFANWMEHWLTNQGAPLALTNHWQLLKLIMNCLQPNW